MITAKKLYEKMPYAIYLTGESDSAQDLIHDVYISLQKGAQPPEDKDRESRYLCACIKYKYYQDQNKKRKTIELHRKLMQLQGDKIYPNNYERSEVIKGVSIIVENHLKHLSDNHRFIWWLFTEGYTKREISELAGKNIYFVRQIINEVRSGLLKLARKKLSIDI